MPNDPKDELDLAEAQLLMSQLMDGEIAPSDADRLHAYLEKHPEAMAWMESLSLPQSGAIPNHSTEEAKAVKAAVLKEIDTPRSPSATIAAANSKQKAKGSAVLLSFPALFRSLAAAAAVVLIGSIAWFALQDEATDPTTLIADSSSVVTFVDTDIPDASPVVYTDAESGWTIVWVDQSATDAG